MPRRGTADNDLYLCRTASIFLERAVIWKDYRGHRGLSRRDACDIEPRIPKPTRGRCGGRQDQQ